MHVMYVHTSFDTSSDRHVLGLLIYCAGVIALCCARGSESDILNDNILEHTTAVLLLLLCYTGTVLKKGP